ncbi:hypothetical protein [Dickeya oryzae]
MRHRKIVWACVVGAAVYGLMLADVFAYILQALAYQGVFVVAWVGVALAHILGHRTLPAATAIRAFNPTGLIAWLLSVIAGVALMHGSALLQSFSAPVTFMVALALYRVLPDSHRVRG